MKKVLLTLAFAGCALMAADGKAVYGKCQGCHGADGKQTAISGKALAGQKAADIEKKLAGYQKGEGGAKKAQMIPMAKGLSADDVKAVASYIATLK